MRHFRTTFIPPPSPNGGGMKRKTAFKSNKCGKPLGQNYFEFVHLLLLVQCDDVLPFFLFSPVVFIYTFN